SPVPAELRKAVRDAGALGGLALALDGDRAVLGDPVPWRRDLVVEQAYHRGLIDREHALAVAGEGAPCQLPALVTQFPLSAEQPPAPPTPRTRVPPRRRAAGGGGGRGGPRRPPPPPRGPRRPASRPAVFRCRAPARGGRSPP